MFCINENGAEEMVALEAPLVSVNAPYDSPLKRLIEDPNFKPAPEGERVADYAHEIIKPEMMDKTYTFTFAHVEGGELVITTLMPEDMPKPHGVDVLRKRAREWMKDDKAMGCKKGYGKGKKGK